MHLGEIKLSKTLGLAIAAIIVVMASAGLAGPVQNPVHFGPTKSGTLHTNCFQTSRETPQLLIWTGHARSISEESPNVTPNVGLSSSWIELRIYKIRECDPYKEREYQSESLVLEQRTCAVDRSTVKEVYDFNLHDSATCIWKLDKDTAYQLVGKHFVKGDANRKSMTMDYVLINIP